MSIYGFTIQDMIANGKVNENDLSVLKEWIARQQMPQYPDETIALLYMACDKDIENTKRCVIAYSNSQRDAPEFFNNRDLAREDVQMQLNTSNFCVFPERTDEGYAIILHRLIDTYPPSYNMVVAIKIYFMTLDTILYDDPPTGIITICDMAGSSIRHTARIEISAVRKFLYFVQEGLHTKMVSVEVLNAVWFFDRIFKIFKPFLRSEFIKKIHVHTSNEDMENFYKNHIPKRCLPSDYGGDLTSVAELQKETLKKLADLSDYFKNEELSRLIPS